MLEIHDSTEAVVDHRFLVKRHSDTPDDTSQDLAARRLGVQDSTGRNCIDDTRDADDAELLVNS